MCAAVIRNLLDSRTLKLSFLQTSILGVEERRRQGHFQLWQLTMFMLSQAAPPGGALSTQRCTLNSAPKFSHPIPPLFSSKRRAKLSLPSTSTSSKDRYPRPLLIVTNADRGGPSTSKPTTANPVSTTTDNPISLVGQDDVPLEGVIQFEKPNSSNSRLKRWAHVALLAGGDVLALLLFSAIGRFSHGFSVFDTETLRTADPFIAGWFLSAYFLGGYGEEGRGMKGQSNALIAAAKSWALGIPLGLFIRASAVGHSPLANFIIVSMGSTAVLLIGWRALLLSILPNDESKKNDQYKRGSAFELFELLTSLIRRW